MYKVEKWEEIKEIQLDIMKRKIFTGEKVMLVKNVIDPHAVLAAHSHPHEQVIYVLSGEANVDIEGEVHHLTEGSMVLVPGDAVHSVTVTSEEPFAAVDIFAPIREDFLK